MDNNKTIRRYRDRRKTNRIYSKTKIYNNKKKNYKPKNKTI